MEDLVFFWGKLPISYKKEKELCIFFEKIVENGRRLCYNIGTSFVFVF